jgi:hypothetical protein
METMTKFEGHSYVRPGSVSLYDMGRGWTLYCNRVDLTERHEMLAAYAAELIAEIERTGSRTRMLNRDIPGHPATIEREKRARELAEIEEAADALAAKLEAAARWQCEPCDRLFKSPEEFMAHECEPKMYVEICPKYKHGVFRYKLGESARCPGCFPDHASLAQIERMEAKPAVPGDDAREFGTPDDIFKGIDLDATLKEAREMFAGFAPDLEPPSAFFAGLSSGSDYDREVIVCGTCKMRGQRQTLRRIVGSCPECNPRPIAVSDRATAAVRRWRDAGGDDDE